MARVAVGGVVGGGQAGGGDDRCEVSFAPAEQGADERDGGGERARRAGAGEAADPAAPGEAHEQGLGLVVGVVGGGDGGQGAGGRPVGKQGIAFGASLGLEVGGWRNGPARGEDGVGDGEGGADGGDGLALGTGGGAEAVVDGRGLDLAGARGVGEEEEGEAVGAAGDGEAEFRAEGGRRFPSTTRRCRAVPLPETSSGRI